MLYAIAMGQIIRVYELKNAATHTAALENCHLAFMAASIDLSFIVLHSGCVRDDINSNASSICSCSAEQLVELQ